MKLRLMHMVLLAVMCSDSSSFQFIAGDPVGGFSLSPLPFSKTFLLYKDLTRKRLEDTWRLTE
jgi:hypothetical protein